MSEAKQVQRYPVYWNSHLVGRVENPRLDMWLLDGIWHPETTQAAAEFQHTIAHLADRAWFRSDPDDLVWVRIPRLNINCTVVLAPKNDIICFHIHVNIKPPKPE